MKKKVAILYICIGKYIAFWKDFYISFEKNFLTEYEKEYFVFTDQKILYDEENNSRIHRIYQQDLGWPGNTLFRFKMFKSVIPMLKDTDYTFFMNANVLCLKEVTEKMILPLDKSLVVVQHPAYYNKKPYEFNYEFRKKSKAYIPCGSGTVYVCGGINGGKTDSYIRLIQILEKNIEEDYQKGIIAKWHDESHINQYVYRNSDYRLLSPSFCYPEDWDIPFEPILLVREKSKAIQLNREKELRAKKLDSFLGKAIAKLVKWKRKMVYIIKQKTRRMV